MVEKQKETGNQGSLLGDSRAEYLTPEPVSQQDDKVSRLAVFMRRRRSMARACRLEARYLTGLR